MDAIKQANLALRFLLELAALVAFGYWGFKTGNGPVSRFLLGLGVPLLVAVIWGMFVAPKSAVTVPAALKVVLGLLVLEAAAIALAVAGAVPLAIVYGVVVAVNAILIVLWGR